VIELAHLSEAQKRAYILADNRLAERAGWDAELLALEAADLDALGVDLGTSASTARRSTRCCRARPTRGRRRRRSRPRSRSAGRRSVAAGAAPAALRRCHGRERRGAAARGRAPAPDGHRPALRRRLRPGLAQRAGAAQTKRTGKVLNDDRADWREAWALFPGEVAYVWHGALHAGRWPRASSPAGFDIRAQIVWAKERLVLSRGHYHWQHEPCWYAVKGKGHWSGDRKQTTLWQIPNRDQDAATVHGTQKPVECMRRPILNNSSPGQAVYEPFSGLGHHADRGGDHGAGLPRDGARPRPTSTSPCSAGRRFTGTPCAGCSIA
jgi:hypothetical protein